MRRYARLAADSLKELKRMPVLTACGLFAALAVVLNMFTINIGSTIKISFSGIPNQLADWLFGPVAGGILAGVLDVVKYLIRPDGAFFPGFTLSAVLAAVIYGFSYYQRPLSFPRVLVTKGIVAVVVNILLNTLWLDMLYGKGFFALLPGRALKDLIMWPIDSVIFFFLAKALEKTGVLRLVAPWLSAKSGAAETEQADPGVNSLKNEK